MANMETHYLGHKVADHWKSIEIKFVEQYGAKDFDRKSLAQAQKGVGQIRRVDLHALWYKECVQMSGYCKDSALREPEYPLTPCGACRTVVRDLMIDIRRNADTPHRAKIGLVEEIFADVCDRVPQRHPPTRAKILQKVCDETLQEDHGDDIGITVHKALAGGPNNWAALGKIDEYSRTWTRQVEQTVCTEDVASCNWDENGREE